MDTAEGQSLSLEVLSQGTREAVFIGLRMALAAAYGRRGAVLPLVLDDVLVNFDTRRAKAAARVSRDFAAAGHQMLLFTCHHHILRIFESVAEDEQAELESAEVTAEEDREAEDAEERAAEAVETIAAETPPLEPEESDADDESVWEEELTLAEEDEGDPSPAYAGVSSDDRFRDRWWEDQRDEAA